MSGYFFQGKLSWTIGLDLQLVIFFECALRFRYNLQEKNLVDICSSTRALIYKSRLYIFLWKRFKTDGKSSSTEF